MKFDGINIIEEANEVFISDNSTNNAKAGTQNTQPEEKTPNRFNDMSVDERVLLNRDTNRNFEEKTVRDKKVVMVNIENANLSFASKFRTFLGQSIKRNAKDIIIDLSYVKKIDSTFIGVLVEGLKKTARYRGNIVLVANTNLMHSSFVLLSLDIFFTSFNSINETMKYFENRLSKAA